MKFFICFAFATFIVLIQANTARDKLKQYSDECKSVSGVSEESLTKARNHESVDDPKLGVHGVCILKKAHFMNDQGQLLVDHIKEKFEEHAEDKEKAKKLVTKCAVQKTTPEETGHDFFACLHADEGH